MEIQLIEWSLSRDAWRLPRGKETRLPKNYW